VEDKTEDPPIDISLLATGYLSTNGSCPLRDSFVYDSGATIHICNRRDRFVDFIVANDPILIGDTEVLVKEYGTVVIWADSVMEGKKVKMTLTDNAFAPNFHTSFSFRLRDLTYFAFPPAPSLPVPGWFV
jgi:hypothetical protein